MEEIALEISSLHPYSWQGRGEKKGECLYKSQRYKNIVKYANVWVHQKQDFRSPCCMHDKTFIRILVLTNT